MNQQPGHRYANLESRQGPLFDLEILTVTHYSLSHVTYQIYGRQPQQVTTENFWYKLDSEGFVCLDNSLLPGAQFWLHDDRDYWIYRIINTTDNLVRVSQQRPFIVEEATETAIPLPQFINLLKRRQLSRPPLPSPPFNLTSADGLHLQIQGVIASNRPEQPQTRLIYQITGDPHEIALLIEQKKLIVEE